MLHLRIGRSRLDSVVYRRQASRIPANMSKRPVDIDDDLLEEAATVLGAAHDEGGGRTGHSSLSCWPNVVPSRDRLEKMRGLDLADTKVMSAAWRSTRRTSPTRPRSPVSRSLLSRCGFDRSWWRGSWRHAAIVDLEVLYAAATRPTMKRSSRSGEVRPRPDDPGSDVTSDRVGTRAG